MNTLVLLLFYLKNNIFFKKNKVSDNEKHIPKSLLLEPMKYKRA